MEFIGQDAFRRIGGNILADGNNPTFSSQDGVLFNKAKTLLIQCPDNKASYSIPSTVKTIGLDAFMWCFKLQSVTIPSSVDSLAPGSFDNCGLTSVVIPWSIKSIPESAFFYCNQLKQVTIPSSVSEI